MEKNNGLHGGAILVSEEAILTEINLTNIISIKLGSNWTSSLKILF
jgi:hypothetical protein